MKNIVIRSVLGSLLSGLLLGCAGRDDGTKRMQAYLQRNAAVVPAAPDGAFQIPAGILDRDVGRCRVIFTGEVHGMEANYRLRRAFLVYLQRAAGLKYLLLEAGPSQAGTLNRYLQTGDTTLLDEMYSYLQGTYEWTQESYAFWQSVYAFNHALPPPERLTCVGIDIEHQPAYALACLKTLLPREVPPGRIAPQINLVRAFSRDDRTYFDVAAKLSSGLEADGPEYQRYLGANFFEFQLIAEGMRAAREAYSARQSGGQDTAFNQLRDQAMYTAFTRQHDRLPPGTYWGHFGDAHAYHKSSENVEWLGARLERDGSPVAGRVLSIAFAYDRCRAMIRTSTGYSISGAASVRPGLFDFCTSPDPVLFKLTGRNSPAYQFQLVTRIASGGSAEYFDYLVLIRGAVPTQPLRVADVQH